MSLSDADLPVTLDFFKKCTYHEALLEKIFKAKSKGNADKLREYLSSESRKERELLQYYRAFYLNPETRKNHPIGLKPMPQKEKIRLLQYPKSKKSHDENVVDTGDCADAGRNEQLSAELMTHRDIEELPAKDEDKPDGDDDDVPTTSTKQNANEERNSRKRSKSQFTESKPSAKGLKTVDDDAPTTSTKQNSNEERNSGERDKSQLTESNFKEQPSAKGLKTGKERLVASTLAKDLVDTVPQKPGDTDNNSIDNRLEIEEVHMLPNAPKELMLRIQSHTKISHLTSEGNQTQVQMGTSAGICPSVNATGDKGMQVTRECSPDKQRQTDDANSIDEQTDNSLARLAEPRLNEEVNDTDLICVEMIHTLTLSYLLRTSIGLKQRITQTLSELSLQEFKSITQIYGGQQSHDDDKYLQRLYDCVCKVSIWPKQLYIKLEDLLLKLAQSELISESTADLTAILAYISPKFLHWSNLITTTNFSLCVCSDYLHREGKIFDITNKDIVEAELKNYYNRCWIYEQWIGEIPKINPELLKILRSNKTGANNVTTSDASIHRVTLQPRIEEFIEQGNGNIEHIGNVNGDQNLFN